MIRHYCPARKGTRAVLVESGPDGEIWDPCPVYEDELLAALAGPADDAAELRIMRDRMRAAGSNRAADALDALAHAAEGGAA